MFMDLVKMAGNVKRNLEIAEKVIKIRKRELAFIWDRKLRKEAKKELNWWINKQFYIKEHLQMLTAKIKNYDEGI